MKLYTCQLSKWRKALELGIPFKDITVKSGDKQFAPTWDFLMKYKSDLDEESYTKSFLKLMRSNYTNNKEYWVELLNQEELAIGCYCASGKFCHRHLIVKIFKKICEHHKIPFEYKGELV